jgi:hypothetical protein
MSLRSILSVAALLGLGAPPAFAAAFDPQTADPAGVIACKIGALEFTGFMMTVTLDGEPGAWDKRGWTKLDSGNPAFTQYKLPKPISVFGQSSETIIFTNIGMMAVIDGADPVALGKANGIEVITLPKYSMGEKIVDDKHWTDTSGDQKLSVTNHIALALRTYPTHPGKVMIGCKYDADVEMMPK